MLKLPWSGVCILYFIAGYFIIPTNGDYLNVSSNIGDVSELLCLGNVTFTCNAELVGQTIGWYNNNELIEEYTYNREDTFPLAISSEFGFDIQLFSASPDTESETFQFINFSLSTSLNQLQKIQGINLTCGTLFKKSDAINVSTDTLIALTTLNAMYTAIYYGMDENLMQFNVSWDDLGSTSSCNFTYAVEVSTINKQLFNNSLTSEDCDLGACLEAIPAIPNELEVDIYLTIYGTPINGTNIVTAEKNISHSGSLLGNNIKLDNCRSSITCSSLSNDTCTLQYGSNSDYESFSKNVTLPVNVSHMFNFTSQTQYYIQLMKKVNSVNIVQRVSYNTTGNNNSNLFYVVSGYTMLGITIILQIFGYIFCIVSSITNKHDKREHCLLLLGLCISTLLFLLSLAFWISYLITPTFDDCGNRLQQSSLGVLTLIFFLLSAATSPVMCGGFCLFIHPNKNRGYDVQKKENGVDIALTVKQEDDIIENYNFTFGLLVEPDQNELICKNCNVSTDCIGSTKCGACQMDICRNCEKKNIKAFIPRLHKEKTVCNACDELYWKENISIFKAKHFSEIVTVLRSQDSWMKTKYKDIHEGKKLKKCGSCNQDVGSKYFEKLEFDDDKEVCTVCYMLQIRKYHLKKRYQAITGKVLDDKEYEMKRKELTVDLLMKNSKAKAEDKTTAPKTSEV